MTDLGAKLSSPVEVRNAARIGSWSGPTCGLAPGFAQANLVLLPAAQSSAFRAFCASNPQACPLLEEGEVGALGLPEICAFGCDVRTDIPRYRVWRDGVATEELTSLVDTPAWLEGQPWVAFALGCSFSFEEALREGGVEVRHNTLVPQFLAGHFADRW